MNMLVGATLTGAAIPQSANSDPIFAAIEEHKKAKAAFDECFRARKDDDDATPDHFADIETEAACRLVSIVPTSLQGVLALLVYAAEVDTDGMGWPNGLVTDDAQKVGRSWYFYAMKNLAEGVQSHAIQS